VMLLVVMTITLGRSCRSTHKRTHRTRIVEYTYFRVRSYAGGTNAHIVM
jgi:hypothetical protein